MLTGRSEHQSLLAMDPHLCRLAGSALVDENMVVTAAARLQSVKARVPGRLR